MKPKFKGKSEFIVYGAVCVALMAFIREKNWNKLRELGKIQFAISYLGSLVQNGYVNTSSRPGAEPFFLTEKGESLMALFYDINGAFFDIGIKIQEIFEQWYKAVRIKKRPADTKMRR